MRVNPALIGKAGEMLVAAELMRRGVEVAYPASDVGVDLLAFRLGKKQTVPNRIVPIQVKARSEYGYAFQKSWFSRVPGVVLVWVWHVRYELETSPEFFVFQDIGQVESALGDHVETHSWRELGGYSTTKPTNVHIERMRSHQNKWDRILSQLPQE